MIKLARILRLISLAMLSGGSTAIVFAAITLVNAAKAQGIEVHKAAAANAPVFIEYSKVALVFAVCLVISEAMEIKGDLSRLEKKSRWPMARYFASTICAIATFIFCLGIVPPMEEVRVHMKTDEAAKLEFDRLHSASRMVFATSIVFALVSLILPVLSSRSRLD